MKESIAIVGMACRYPDARSPVELWENVLAQRRAFRRMPAERLRVEDYLSADLDTPDCTYSAEAALIEGYEFDRVGFRVAGSTFRSADLVHWLALDVAAQALADAGFRDGDGLPRDTTGVLLGNTLTGEFSRANVMRLRWPYVRRVVEAALIEQGWSMDQRRAFLEGLEAQYKAPFPPIGEETLAGGLSNTIAGRICNHFDLKGGGYTVDGACSSSLLAVSTACSALVAGDLDVALAGGVDLSLDPFELVGFAKAGALAQDEMRVYDVRSAGFWPGEGCGFVVLMRQEDAVAARRRIYALIHGWGISSDGSGGITRPEGEGQLLALRRAYRRAGFGIETVVYFEGHGTGTSVGDRVELEVLSHARRDAAPEAPCAVIGSIKANIGHTKAAAGVAGLIKATMALDSQILPPTTGCEEPHPELAGEAPALRVLHEGESWPPDRPLRVGVSAMGFGGINAHIVLEGVATERRRSLRPRERVLLSSAQDAELLLMGADDSDGLRRQVEHLLTFAAGLSRAELTDLAARLESTLDGCRMRAAIVASSPAELARLLDTLGSWLTTGVGTKLDMRAGVFLGAGVATPRIGFLFPGQGSPAHLGGGALRRRFEGVRELYARAALPTEGDGIATAVAQPAIVTASLAGLYALGSLGMRASIAVGHSVGELTALHWAGALDEKALLRIAAARGNAMADLGSSSGAMASIGAGRPEIEGLLNGEPVFIAGVNSPRHTVVSGEATAVAAVVARARARGLRAVNLPVSHAFHSPLVASAAPMLAEQLAREEFQSLQRPVISTVTGAPLSPGEDLRALLHRQVTWPVRFTEAVAVAVEGLDLFIEVGPGQVLSSLLSEFIDVPVVALDAGGPSLKGLLNAVGAAFVLGAPLNHGALCAGRFTRPFDLDWRPRFFVNPCELAPLPESATDGAHVAIGDAESDSSHVETNGFTSLSPPPSTPCSSPPAPCPLPSAPCPPTNPQSALALIRQLVAQRAELPSSVVKDDSRLLSDLHLNSISAAQLVAEAARCLGLPPPVALTDYADATVGGVAQALEDLSRNGGSIPVDEAQRPPSGVDSWIRSFTVDLVERPLPRRQSLTRAGAWRVIAPPGYPLADSLMQMFVHAGGGGGVVVCLPPEPDERHVGLLLEGARVALAERGEGRFVLVQHGGGGAAFARTLHMETREVTICVVDVPVDHPKAAEWVIAEALAAVGYTEAHYDSSGCRREPVLRLLPIVHESMALPLGPADVVLVTGGGKGIAAECALSLARETGARLALLGRSQPAADTELAANLERMAAAGIDFRYIPADVTDAEAVRAAVREVEAVFGSITAVLHGAGANVPNRLTSLDDAAFQRTLAPKVQGARNVLAALNPDHLRLLVTFGSIIARIGLPGEADYAVANEWLAHLTERFQVEHPACRCLVVEWSVWSGVGMGERLGRVDVLMRQGITPIPPSEGVSILGRLLAQSLPGVSVVVTGRFGDPPTLKLEQPELPILRFLEQPRVYYPGVELVVDAELSSDTDPYLEDHVFRGERLFPAVMGLEAMAQAVMALVGAAEPPVFEDVKFTRPVVVPERDRLRIRVAALVRESGRIDVALRTEQTAFQVDHFRATCRFKWQPTGAQDTFLLPSPPEGEGQGEGETLNGQATSLLLDSEHDLYSAILFQGGRFKRLRGYRYLKATECIAQIVPDGAADWFGRYLPATLVLGDPGVRDAAIHAVQACIPHATLLPLGVDRLRPGTPKTAGPCYLYAHERSREGDTFTYDLEVKDALGWVWELWEGLRLRKVGETARRGPWAAPLLGPYIERRVQELIPGSSVSAVVTQEPLTDGLPSPLLLIDSLAPASGERVRVRGGYKKANRRAETERRERSDRAIQQALGTVVPIWRRPDGKPVVIDDHGVEVSAAHAGDLVVAVAGPAPVACDLEPVVARPPSTWQDLLGTERFRLAEFIANPPVPRPHWGRGEGEGGFSERGSDDLDAAATRVWAASECLKKAGAMVNAPLVLTSSTADGWIMLASGPLTIATFVAAVRGVESRLALAVLARIDDARV